MPESLNIESGSKTDRAISVYLTALNPHSPNMPGLIRCYKKCGVNVPIRVDHVPVMAEENSVNAGYDTLGRLFAIGYLKGILESIR